MEQQKDKSFGLWIKTAKSGRSYFGGKCEIEGKEYTLTLFDNQGSKTKDTQPDFSLIIKEYVKPDTQGNPFADDSQEGLPF